MKTIIFIFYWSKNDALYYPWIKLNSLYYLPILIKIKLYFSYQISCKKMVAITLYYFIISYYLYIFNIICIMWHTWGKSCLSETRSYRESILYMSLRCWECTQFSITWRSVWTNPHWHKRSSMGSRPRPRLFQRPVSIAREWVLSHSFVQDFLFNSFTAEWFPEYIEWTIRFG